MTCKDCAHYEVCKDKWSYELMPILTPYNGKGQKTYMDGMENKCKALKPKSRFVELPCEVGQTVWFETWKKNGTECIGIQPHKIDRIDIDFVCDAKNFIETKIPNYMIGKTVFLSREEAEKALAERSK
jgi:hypothetical protein